MPWYMVRLIHSIVNTKLRFVDYIGSKHLNEWLETFHEAHTSVYSFTELDQTKKRSFMFIATVVLHDNNIYT